MSRVLLQERAMNEATQEQVPAQAVKKPNKKKKAKSQPAAHVSAVATSGQKLKQKDYDKALKQLHIELVKLQQWVVHKGIKICIIFEGRDGAGKGGTIKAITERVSPRIFRVVALPAPSDREKSQIYIQRYLTHLPAGGEVVIFDRSWYNRAGVERVMGFCTEAQAKGFLSKAPFVEKAIVDSGIMLFKYWLEVSPDIQTERLKARIHDKRKTWKLSPMDVKSYTRWDDYTKARDDMFAATDTEFAPWYVAHSDDKKQVRIDIITHLLSKIPYEKVPAKTVKLPKRKVKTDKPGKLKVAHVVPKVEIQRSEAVSE
jgi:polyphosphate kinase 2